MLQRHLDNRSIPVWSKVIPQSRGSHQQPAALSTFSRRRVVPLSGELVCSFKSVQCSTSFSKIGHLISLVAFQLQHLLFNCTSCTSSGSRFLQDGYKGAGHDHISLKMIELFWLRSHLAVLVGLRTMKTNTNQNRNKYKYRYLASQCCCGWDLTQWSAPGTIPVQLAPLSTCLTHSTLLEARISRIGKFQIYKSTIFFEIHRVQWLIIMSRDQILLYNLEMGISIAFVTSVISYDMKFGQTPGWCWQLNKVRQDTGVHQRPAGNWGSCSCWESESDSEKEEEDGVEMDALAKFGITVMESKTPELLLAPSWTM